MSAPTNGARWPNCAFFTSLLPQFGATDAGPSFWLMLAFGLLFGLMTWLWLVLYATAIQRLGDALRSSRVRRSIEAVTGTGWSRSGCDWRRRSTGSSGSSWK